MQNTELPHSELRPLGAGELLDRAVTLFVRNFVPIVAVLATVLVPVVVFEAIMSPHVGKVFSDFGRVFSAGGNRAASEAAIQALSRDSASSGWSYLVSALGVVARLLMWSAIVALVATAYAGARISFGDAYRIGVRRWFSQVIVALTFAVMGVVTSIPVIIAYVVLLIVVSVLVTLSQAAAALVVAIVGGLIVFGAIAIVLSWVFMVYELASVAVVTETANAVEAIGTALRRGFARGMRRRTIVGGLVVFAVSQVGTIPLLVVATLATTLTHTDMLFYAILGVGTVLLQGIVAAFVVVYAVDIRVRREGFDIIAPEAPPVLQ